MKRNENLKFKIENRLLSTVLSEVEGLEKEILATIRYFFFFDYPPTSGEIYTFLKKRALKRRFTGILKNMVKKGALISWKNGKRNRSWLGNEKLKKDDRNITKNHFIFPFTIQASNPPSQFLTSSNNPTRYTLPQYSIHPKTDNEAMKQLNNYQQRHKISINKLNLLRFRLYLKLLSLISQITLIGLSGSVAMFNADRDHDIDLFIITAKSRLWTGRFLTLLFAQLLGVRRKRHRINQKTEDRNRKSDKSENQKISLQTFRFPSSDFSGKVCLNLFFDESDLTVPKFKKTEFVAHEVLQMKPLIDKNNTYLRFIDANEWVFAIFPNSKLKFQSSNVKSNSKFKKAKFEFWILRLICNLNFVVCIFDRIELFLKNFQLRLINRHRTTEIITATQLWFHPDDFSKKIIP